MAVLLGLALAGCIFPTSNRVQLQSIKQEALVLMARYPDGAPYEWNALPKDRWPPTIAELNPESVEVSPRGVHISVKMFLDGGWGYEVPRTARDLGMAPFCYKEPYPGVFWHAPC